MEYRAFSPTPTTPRQSPLILSHFFSCDVRHVAHYKRQSPLVLSHCFSCDVRHVAHYKLQPPLFPLAKLTFSGVLRYRILQKSVPFLQSSVYHGVLPPPPQGRFFPLSPKYTPIWGLQNAIFHIARVIVFLFFQVAMTFAPYLCRRNKTWTATGHESTSQERCDTPFVGATR